MPLIQVFQREELRSRAHDLAAYTSLSELNVHSLFSIKEGKIIEKQLDLTNYMYITL